MKLDITTEDITKQQHADCIVVGIYETLALTPSATQLDNVSKGYLKKILKHGDFQGKIGQTFLLYSIPHISASRILLVGCGKPDAMSIRDYRKMVSSSIKALQQSTQISQISTYLTEINVTQQSYAWKIKQAAEVFSDTLYRFVQFKTKKEQVDPTIKKAVFYVPKKEKGACQQALNQAIHIASAVEFVKNLANLPSNICTPSYLAMEAKKLAKAYPSISVKILEEKDMKKLGMNAFLSVTKGSKEEAKLICLEYKSAKKTKAPVAFVGKGITFDTGGISLKSPESLIGMKYDMCGAATVLGVLKASAALQLQGHVIGILAAAENMPGPTASKPEDIVTSLSGQTIEIMNTDAEGRLVLCDALTYCERYRPEIVIDIATLTGAAVVALGYHATAMLTNNNALAKDLIASGIESHDRVWEMPLWEEYQEQLKSPFADVSNVGGRAAGTITAACFLSRFAKKFAWAHLDVAGTAAMMGGNDRYATGRPLPLLMQYLINRFPKKK